MSEPVATVEVDLDSAVPAYEQIRAQLAGHIGAGTLRPGDRLPAVRALAADLGLAVGTVNRAYAELEASGLVRSRRRTGTVVTAAQRIAADVTASAETLVRAARRHGVGDNDVLDLVRSLLRSQAGPAN
jgi:GntR family transcriptional regulator